MLYRHIAEFDASPYLSTTRFTLAEGVTLAKALAERAPKSPPGVVQALAAVIEVADEAEAAMVERLRAQTRKSNATGVDYAIDGVWSFARASLARWAYLDRDTLALLAEDTELADEVDLAPLEARIDEARQLVDELFAAERSGAWNGPYTAQAQATANLLRLIEDDAHGPALARTVLAEIMPLLRASQRRYQAMVGERLDGPSGSVDLGQLRIRLQRVISFYSSSVVGMLSLGGPERIPVVEAALHPILALRQRRARARSGDEGDSDARDRVDELVAADADAPALADAGAQADPDTPDPASVTE